MGWMGIRTHAVEEDFLRSNVGVWKVNRKYEKIIRLEGNMIF